MYARAECSNKHTSGRKTSPRGAAGGGGRVREEFSSKLGEPAVISRWHARCVCGPAAGQLASSLIKAS
jgi:hypothetical protein